MLFAALMVAVLASASGSPHPTPTPTPTPASPAAAAQMTLPQAVAYALTHNEQVLTAKAQWVSAQATLTRDRSAGLPNVQGVAQSTMDRQSNSGSFAQFGLRPQPNFSQNTAELVGSQPIFDMTTSLSANQARHNADAAAANLRLVKEQTTLAVETSYYTYVEDAQLVDLASADYAYQQTLYAVADANYRSGRVAGIDRLQAQVQRTSSEENLASATADAEDARQNLAQAIGADPSQQFVLPSAVPVPPMPALDQNALDAVALRKRPDVTIARDELSIAVLANGLIDAPNRPIVTLQGGVGNQVTPTQFALNNLPAPFGCGSPYCTSTHFYTVQLSSQLSLPLLDWGTLHSAHNGARASIDAQTATFLTAERQALIDVDQAIRRLKVDDQNLALATQNADVAKRAAQIAQVQYKAGLGSQLDVTSAEQTYLQAAKQLLAAQVGYVLESDRLKLATGTLVD